MVNRLLANLICTFLFSAVSLSTVAQSNHYIYIQTENNQPFYIRLNGKVISSTTDGYVILSKLKEGEYPLIIGFPRNEAPEKVYVVNLGNQDEGFLLKKLDNQFSLFNIESLALIEGSSTQTEVAANEPQTEVTKEKKEEKNAFTSLLATVVKDSSLLTENPEKALAEQKKEAAIAAKDSNLIASVDSTKAEQKLVASSNASAGNVLNTVIAKEDSNGLNQKNEKIDSVQIAQNNNPGKDTSVGVQIDSLVTPANTAISEIKSQENNNVSKSPANKQPEFQVQKPVSTVSAGIKRLMLMNEANGLDMVYLDRNMGDTIRMFMPVTNMKKDSGKPTAKIFYNPQKQQDISLTITPTIVQAPQQQAAQPKTQIDSAKSTVKETVLPNQSVEPAKNDVTPVQTEKVDTAMSVREIKDTAVITKKSQAAFNLIVNSDCKSIATDKEFNKLWKKMLTRVGDDNMIDEAKKFFRKECFTVEQIRELSRIFLYDKGKYDFFDAAYPYASDSNMFYALESELHDPYYINRFKAMIQK